MRFNIAGRRRNSFVGTLVALAVGVIFVIIGISILSNQAKFKKTGVPAVATVTNLVAHKSSDSTTFRPEVSFKTKDGKTITIVHSTGSNPPRYKVGDQVNIYYAPDLPEHIMFDSGFETFLFPGIFIVVGGICVLAVLSSIGRRIFFGR